MTIDLHTILTLLLGCVTAVMGWLGRQIWDAVTNLRKDLNELEVAIGREYIRYDRFQDLMRPVMQKLERIEDVLMHKVDKP